MAALVPAVVASLAGTSTLDPVSYLISTKLLAVADSCSVAAPAEWSSSLGYHFHLNQAEASYWLKENKLTNSHQTESVLSDFNPTNMTYCTLMLNTNNNKNYFSQPGPISWMGGPGSLGSALISWWSAIKLKVTNQRCELILNTPIHIRGQAYRQWTDKPQRVINMIFLMHIYMDIYIQWIHSTLRHSNKLAEVK